MRVKDGVKLKAQLQEQRNKLQVQQKLLNAEIHEKQQEATSLKSRISTLQKEIDKIKYNNTDEVIISDHAMLRYIERVLGIDIEELKRKIVPSDKLSAKSIMNGSYSFETHKIVVKNNTVVTVTEV